MTSEQISPAAKRFIFTVMITSTLGGLLFGYDTGVINGALPYMAQPDQLNLTPALEGFVVSALLLGAAIGSVTGGRIADLMGRRRMILALAVIFFFAALGCTLSPTVYVMLPCRFILGLAVGGASVTVPVYLAEVAPADKRGRMVTQNELMIVSGQFLAYICNAILGTLFDGTGHVWRYMLFLATLPALALFFGMLRMPESPRWLVLKGKVSDSLAILKKLRGSQNTAIAELNDIQDNIAQQAAIKQFGWKDLKRPWVRHILFIGIGVAVATRFTGVNTIMFYGTQILTEAGFGRQIALIANVANGLTSVLATFVGIWLLGKIGRRTMFLTGICGTMFALIVIALSSIYLSGSTALPFIVLSMTIFFLAFMQACIGPVLWLIIAEIFPLQLRGLGMGICIFFLWIVDFCVGTAFPILLSAIGLGATFFFFVGALIIAFIFVKTCVPETKGKSLEEIERYFRSLYPDKDEKQSTLKA
ncbi:sugar porter family MFS transporter [Mitsuokella sp.]|uniref:sugar porter family MFS transporter n=1 Tax=unclassified Mitsuokella TaxID=2637239 RepID=UPI003D7E1D7C